MVCENKAMSIVHACVISEANMMTVRPDSCKQSDSCKHTNYTHIRMFI